LSTPLTAKDFAERMARLGPFERAPAIAVGVSGGPDSLALTLLLAEWASGRGGRVEAITVDHGLRPDSAAEARQVGDWLRDRPGLRHRVLVWSGEKPSSGIQARARAARYTLLTEHCRVAGILHLCLAHHLGDQQETNRMRAGRGSGQRGLAGMNAVRAWCGVRLLRPLLGVAKSALQATLAGRGQPWIDDPSNRNAAFERVRLRKATADGEAATPVADLHRLGLERRRLESAAAALLAESLAMGEEGVALLDPDRLQPGRPEAVLALGSLLQAVGGADYLPGSARLERALSVLATLDWPGFTLGGCLLSRRGRAVLIGRDWGAIRDRRRVRPGDRLLWDGRFDVAVAGDLAAEGEFSIAPLGERGVQWLGRHGHPLSGHAVAEPIRKALPALWSAGVPVAVPQLGFGTGLVARFRPAQAATSCGFTVAY
jgi:tRNA(Ile)-lysidine synthase